MSEFVRMRIGPVIFKDEITYVREIKLLEEIRVTLELAALSMDGQRSKMKNTFVGPDEKPVASVLSKGGWLNLTSRKLVAAPERVLVVLKMLVHSDNFITA